MNWKERKETQHLHLGLSLLPLLPVHPRGVDHLHHVLLPILGPDEHGFSIRALPDLADFGVLAAISSSLHDAKSGNGQGAHTRERRSSRSKKREIVGRSLLSLEN